MRIVYANDATKRVLGFNVMGVRFRQDVCTHWIERQTSVEEVLTELGAANFDPEFFPECEAYLVAECNRQTGRSLVANSSCQCEKQFSYLTLMLAWRIETTKFSIKNNLVRETRHYAALLRSKYRKIIDEELKFTLRES